MFHKVSTSKFPPLISSTGITAIAVLTAIFIILFYFFFNFNYLSNWIDEKGDARTYNYYVKIGLPQYLYNPHHLFFDRLGQWFYEIMEHNGYKGSSMRILQLRNLIISSICLGIIFFLFYLFSHRYFLSLLFTSLIAFSCAVWIYAQINDTGLIHSILLFLLFFAALYFPRVKHKILYSLFLGLFHSMIVIVFHQTDIIFISVIFFIIIVSGNGYKDRVYVTTPHFTGFIKKNQKVLQKPIISLRLRNIRYFLIYMLILAIIVVAAYYYIGIIVLNLSLDPKEADYFNQIKGSTYFFNWIVLYANINYWGKGFLKGNLFEKAIKGITAYFYQPGKWEGKNISPDFSSFTSPHSLLPNLIILFIFIILSGAIVFSLSLYRRYHYVFITTMLFLLLYVLFACWWEPDYREFWIAPMFGFWFLAFLMINFILEKLKGLWPLPHIVIYVSLSVITGLLFYVNFTTFIYPRASTEFRVFDIIEKGKK